MNLDKQWEKALDNTEIKRQKIQKLYTFRPTEIPYVILSASSINKGDTVVREGKISVDKPVVILPDNSPKLEGFDFQPDMNTNSDDINSFLFMRGIKLPSLNYNNDIYSLDIMEKSLKEAKKYHLNLLERKEDTSTGLIIGPEDCWQFSLVIYVAALIEKSAGSDIQNILRRFKNRYN